MAMELAETARDVPRLGLMAPTVPACGERPAAGSRGSLV